MLLGFKPQFAPYVLDGTKTHTIRATRKNPPRVGEICHCYTGLRTKQCKLLGRWPCVKVERIAIQFGHAGIRITIDDQTLDNMEAELFAIRDGFRPSNKAPFAALFAMRDFWVKAHKIEPGQIFGGQVIHWEWNA